MKKYFGLIGGILLLLLGIGLGTIGVATIVMIIQSGSADRWDIALGIIMLVFVVGGVSMILKGGKLIRNTHKEINPQYLMEKEENKKPAKPLMKTDYGSNRRYVMDKQERKAWTKIWIAFGLPFVGMLCLEMRGYFREDAAVKLVITLVGFVCILAVDILAIIEEIRSPKWQYENRILALAKILFWVVVYWGLVMLDDFMGR